jgi:NADH-quinone oxidoreductase subunit J
MLRCIYCGLCEEVCPEEAIFLQKQYSMSGYSRAEMVNHKDRLYEMGGTLPDKHFKWDEEGRRGGGCRREPLGAQDGTNRVHLPFGPGPRLRVRVVLSKNAVNGAMCLLLCLAGVAGLFVQLHAYLLAFVLVLVYAGAVVALFLFIIMLLDMQGGQPWRLRGLATCSPRRSWRRCSSRGSTSWPSAAGLRARPATGHSVGSSLKLYAYQLFTTYLLPVQVMGFLLLIAMLGVIVLSRRNERPEDPNDAQPRSLRDAERRALRRRLPRRPRPAQHARDLHVPRAHARGGDPGARRVLAFQRDEDGDVFVFFILTVAAAEVAVGLAIIVALFRPARRSRWTSSIP